MDDLVLQLFFERPSEFVRDGGITLTRSICLGCSSEDLLDVSVFFQFCFIEFEVLNLSFRVVL